jgi:hypothetical protein
MAGAAGHRWNGVLLRGRTGGGHRNSAVRWSSEERFSSLAETHTHSLLFNADSCVHSRTLEPDWYPTGVAICPAGNGGREVWASVVAVLHTERNCSQAAARWHCEKLRVDHGGSSAVAAFCFRVRAWDCSASLDFSRLHMDLRRPANLSQTHTQLPIARLPGKRTLLKSTCPANLRAGWLINALLFFAFALGSATMERVEGANCYGD